MSAQGYQLQIGEPYWMPEIGLGIGRGRQVIGGIEQEALLWHDAQGKAYPTPEGVMQELQQQLHEVQGELDKVQGELDEVQGELDEVHQRAERLAEYVRSLGIDPDNLPEP